MPRRLLAPSFLLALACGAGKKDADTGAAFEGDDIAECTDGADNDRNGLFDCDDAGCAASPDCADPTTDTADTGRDTGRDTGDDTDTGTPGRPSVDVYWSGDGVEFVIRGSSGGWHLGIAETNGSADPWTGEDCHQGYTMGGGDTFVMCHFLDPSGGFLESVTSLEELADGTTLFDETYQTNLTYMLSIPGTEDCWSWGDARSYYAALGCDAVD